MMNTNNLISKGRWVFDVDKTDGTVTFTSTDWFLFDVVFVMFPDGHVDVFWKHIPDDDMWRRWKTNGGIAVDDIVLSNFSPAGRDHITNRSGKGFKSIKRAIRFARKLMR